jgi:hypothetical protein
VCDVSDHFFTFVSIPGAVKTKHKHKTIISRDFSQQNLQNFKTALSIADWSNVTSLNDIDLAYDAFWSTYNSLYITNFPVKRIRFNKNRHKINNFMTGGLLVSRETKKKLHRVAVSDPNELNINKYKVYKSAYQRIIRAAKKLYLQQKLEQNASNPKKTWETLNEILGKTRGSDSVTRIRINGAPEDNVTKIADHFNTFFTSIGQEISDSVPPVSKPAEEYINYGRLIPDLELGNTTPEHVLKIIKQFKPKNSCDIQGVSTKMVKFVGAELAGPLSHIFNISLSCGVFPTKLKQCRVIPIFKSGDQLECDNYRPISLLSSISKILEKIVAEKLVHHLTSHDLLYCHQYGFLPNRSTEHNLIQLTNYITTALNEGMYCMAVFLDLKKAFDVCSHDILLKKLRRMGIRGKTHEWFVNYLAGRSQCVEVGGSLSAALDINISVIQGSILGPILFLCYINDFWRATSLFSLLFADDTSCLAKGKNLRTLTEYVNVELQKVANWFRSNKMAVNAAKTKFIVFRTHGKGIDQDDCLVVYNMNEIGQPADPSLISPIERIHNNGTTTCFKLLGVLFDEYLSFDQHVSNLCSRVSKSLFCLNKLKNFVNQGTLVMLYYAMIHSHLMYCINVYGCANKSVLDKLRIKQKQAIRVIANAGYLDHTEPLFARLKIMNIDMLLKYAALKFMHNYVNRKLPLSFANTWITNRERLPNRELRNADDLYILPHKYATLKRMQLFTFPKIWNEADLQKHNPAIPKFLSYLKRSMFTNPAV